MRTVATLIRAFTSNRVASVEVFATTASTIHRDNIVNFAYHSSTKTRGRTSRVHMFVNVSFLFLKAFCTSHNLPDFFSHLRSACGCDPKGSRDEGICDSVSNEESGIVAGSCHCKPNVRGRQCEVCKEGYWNLDAESPDGCELCTCNILGTHNNSGCNMHTGECTCKALVTGKDCNQCLPETFGLSDSYDGCTHCDCDPGGSLDNNCDVISGQCRCRSHMTGRTCSTPKPNHFVSTLHNVYEAEIPDVTHCASSSNYGVRIYSFRFLGLFFYLIIDFDSFCFFFVALELHNCGQGTSI